jgi:hypothetical protein
VYYEEIIIYFIGHKLMIFKDYSDDYHMQDDIEKDTIRVWPGSPRILEKDAAKE